MTWADILLYIAATTAIVAAWKNGTAAALVVVFFVIQAWYFSGEENILDQRGYLFMLDFAVVVCIFAKTIMRCEESVSDCVAHLTIYDRLILATYLFGTWPVYVANISDYPSRWFALWAIAMVQFLLADFEAFSNWRQAKALQSEPGQPPGVLRVAWAGAGDSG